MGGKNPGKPQKRAGGGGGDDQTETEKPFHSKEFMQQELDNLLNAPERPTWDEFKEQQRKKGEMEGDMDKVEQEAQDRFRKELDADRAARLARKPAEEEGGSKKKKKEKHKSKKDKKEKKEKKDKSKKKKRHRDSSDSDSSSEDVKRSKSSKGGMQAPVSLSSFFSAGDSD
mmetsp:Transcript_80046/g.193927  ORF Transcript_80046/g.193927 Transcript_80046/m.193927 type:complete len:171 (+) Transcript_80046:64-576(+)